jgi:outer membrane protein OmpA-like peptidoglycan-associated protein
MRTASWALFAGIALTAGSAPAESASEAFIFSLKAESRDLAFEIRNLVFKIEDVGGGVQELETSVRELEVKESETEIRIAVPADVLFDFGSAKLRDEAKQSLREVAAILREHEGATVRVEGHTDAKGSGRYNQKLSEQRAVSVRNWLAAEGLSANFRITGFGESNPAVPNATSQGADDPQGRQKNRRVEIVVEKQSP